MRSIRGWIGFGIFGLASLAALFVAAAVEFGLTTPVPEWAYPLFALLWLAFLWPFLRESPLKVRFLLPVIFLAGLVLLHSSWDSRGSFIRRLNSVKPGMSVEQVEERMSRYDVFREPNTRLLASGQRELIRPNLAVYHCETPEDRFNADAGIVIFKNNKVESVRFSPD
jgi:hypothetical protein